MTRLDEIRERWESAIPGPWEVADDPLSEVRLVWAHFHLVTSHAREDVPALLEMVERRDAAVQAVLDLHAPNERGYCPVCAFAMSPCETVAAVTAAIGEPGDHA